MKTGTNASIGPGLKPSGPASRPSWNTMTSSPKAEPVDSRFSRIALIGITIERNVTSIRMNASPKTNAKTKGSLLLD